MLASVTFVDIFQNDSSERATRKRFLVGKRSSITVDHIKELKRERKGPARSPVCNSRERGRPDVWFCKLAKRIFNVS